ncbi:putative spermidine/putrescine transport system ATP-binding protein [Geodermatophilus bullaregiensis]|uniref:ABC transporter ATP-binding protein n=1 Tax=Geodermatophilus bullaregiensis TaxID=1564160 RepID=UPI00195A32C9|nr:ABC transporter ATP-binding protein [Geodermatophilus bullaregiensis]MBM7808843.1 putative spermidine/putrescine transport system ATP-binding protein [Geodermatophilus bullaregiensis]
MSAELRVAGLRREFGGAVVLDGVDLTVPAGGCVALLGPSGTGKSTVLRLVAGLDTPDAGRVTAGGRDLTGLAPERRGTAMVGQRPRLFPHLSVLDNVAFPLAVAGRRRRAARAEAAGHLDLVGLGDLAGRRPATLSGGQEQRVALARALAAAPAVLLLDEPFSALDPGVRADMHRLLADLRSAVSPTVLLVTHDRQEAAAVADTVAVLLDGRIAQHDTAEALHTRPASLAVHRFLGGLVEVPGRVEGGAHVSALGRLALPCAPPPGPAVLVVRQEAVGLVAAGDPAADATGTVGRVAPRGARSLVEVATAAGTLAAEAGPGLAPPAGAAVGLVLPVAQRWVVAQPAAG